MSGAQRQDQREAAKYRADQIQYAMVPPPMMTRQMIRAATRDQAKIDKRATRPKARIKK